MDGLAFITCLEGGDYGAERLSSVLDSSWLSKHSVNVINISLVLESYKPRTLTLSEVAAEYIALKNILSKPTEIAFRTLIELVGVCPSPGFLGRLVF